MKKRRLLQSGKLVSEIGLGCMSFAGFYGPTDEKEAHNTLNTALDYGIDFLDTANIYGMGVSETMIGNYIKNNGNPFVIATKASISRDPETNERTFDNSSQHLETELNKSLERLGVDNVDLFYIHRRDPRIPIEDVMETLLKFKKEGKIGGIGFSEISPSSLRRASEVGLVDAIQSEYSLWTRSAELGLIQTCQELEVSFIPFSPLGRGIFSTKPPDPSTFGKLDFRKNNPRFLQPNFNENLNLLAPFKQLCAELGVSPSTMAIAWTLKQGEHMLPIPGTRSRNHLIELALGSEFELTEEISDQIDHLLPIGWAHGERYSDDQWIGIEKFC
jgi:aryl-alcohol dehydrogenase-like predicted oxidoreductase